MKGNLCSVLYDFWPALQVQKPLQSQIIWYDPMEVSFRQKKLLTVTKPVNTHFLRLWTAAGTNILTGRILTTIMR